MYIHVYTNPFISNCHVDLSVEEDRIRVVRLRDTLEQQFLPLVDSVDLVDLELDVA